MVKHAMLMECWKMHGRWNGNTLHLTQSRPLFQQQNEYLMTEMKEPTWELPRKLKWVVIWSDFELRLMTFIAIAWLRLGGLWQWTWLACCHKFAAWGFWCDGHRPWDARKRWRNWSWHQRWEFKQQQSDGRRGDRVVLEPEVEGRGLEGGCGCNLFGQWLADSPFVYTAQEEKPGDSQHPTMLQERHLKDWWKRSPRGVLQVVLVSPISDILSVFISLFRKSRVAQPHAFFTGNVSTQWTHLSW